MITFPSSLTPSLQLSPSDGFRSSKIGSSSDNFQSSEEVVDLNPFPESPQETFFDISLARLGSLAHPKPIMSKEESNCHNSDPGAGDTSGTQDLNKIKVLLVRLAFGR